MELADGNTQQGSFPQDFPEQGIAKNVNCAQSRCGAHTRRTRGVGDQARTQALVAACDTRERRARSRARCLQTDQREEDRGVAETLGRSEPPPQNRRLSLRALDAHLLYKPSRQELAEIT